MNQFDFDILCCVHFAKPYLPEELRRIIFENRNPVFSETRENIQNPLHKGFVRSSRRQRVIRCYKCLHCGTWTHPGRCGRRRTDSRYEFMRLIRVGAIRYQVKRSPNRYETIVDLALQMNRIDLNVTIVEGDGSVPET
jgi:hypothetical protein